MTEFEKKLFNDLRAGHSVDELVAEFRSHVDVASKALAEETEASAAQEKQGQAIAELANRMLNQELTADDVAWVMQIYFMKLAEEMGLGECENLDRELRTSIRDLLVEFTDMAKALYTTLPALNERMDKAAAKVPPAAPGKSDEDILREFVQQIL